MHPMMESLDQKQKFHPYMLNDSTTQQHTLFLCQSTIAAQMILCACKVLTVTSGVLTVVNLCFSCEYSASKLAHV